MRQVASLILILAASGGVSTHQLRDSAGPSTGTAVIAGTVVSRERGQPIRGARVALTAPALESPIIVSAGDDGSFRFEKLAPGAYRLWAIRAGFLAASYGEKRPGAGLPGARITVAAGQRVETLRIELTRGGSISGTVLEADAEPAVGTMVVPLRIAIRSGRETLIPAGFQESDDRGSYRFHGLQPGEYVVAAIRMGVGLTRMLAEGGGFHGQAGHVPPQLLSPMEDRMGISMFPMFHPAGTRVGDASRVTVAAADELARIDIRLSRDAGARVTGVVREADGSAPSGDGPIAVVLRSREPQDTPSLVEFAPSNMTFVNDGAFEMSGVPPGQYELTVRRSRQTDDWQWASQPLTVAGSNIEGLVLRLQPGQTVTIAVDSDAALPPDLQELFLTLEAASIDSDGHETGHAAKLTDGRFVARGVPPGKYRISLPSELSGWRLASATFGGRDVLDFPFEVTAGENPNVRATLTRSTTQISGRITGALDPATNYTVIAFAAEPQYWTSGSRRSAAAEADALGAFAIDNLPAGRYRLAVVEDFDSLAGVHPALIRQLARDAAPSVSITDGARVVQDVRIR